IYTRLKNRINKFIELWFNNILFLYYIILNSTNRKELGKSAKN
ncbi:unnamed protein product, partial [marine sediment metagenome]